MARLLLLLQLIVALVVLPFWPGLEPRYAVLGLVFLGVAVLVPVAGACSIFGPRAVADAAADAWEVRPLGPRADRSAEVWRRGTGLFSLGGILGGLVALVGAFSQLGRSDQPVAEGLTLALFALVWGSFGVLLSGILHRTVARLSLLAPTGASTLVPQVAAAFGLTLREAEVAGALLEGLTYRDIGERLHIAPATVKSHVLKAYEKTGAGSKMELLRMVEARSARLHQTVDGATDPAGRS